MSASHPLIVLSPPTCADLAQALVFVNVLQRSGKHCLGLGSYAKLAHLDRSDLSILEARHSEDRSIGMYSTRVRDSILRIHVLHHGSLRLCEVAAPIGARSGFLPVSSLKRLDASLMSRGQKD